AALVGEPGVGPRSGAGWRDDRPCGGLGDGMKSPTLADAEAAVRHGLLQAAGTLAAEGVRTPPVEGKLLRPLLAYALVPEPMRRHLDPGFWFGALAIQMVHEA